MEPVLTWYSKITCNILLNAGMFLSMPRDLWQLTFALGNMDVVFEKNLKCWFLLILVNFTIHCTIGDFYLHSCHGNHKSIPESELQDCGNLSDILDHYVI